jgi:hypothetical protein
MPVEDFRAFGAALFGPHVCRCEHLNITAGGVHLLHHDARLDSSNLESVTPLGDVFCSSLNRLVWRTEIRSLQEVSCCLPLIISRSIHRKFVSRDHEQKLSSQGQYSARGFTHRSGRGHHVARPFDQHTGGANFCLVLIVTRCARRAVRSQVEQTARCVALSFEFAAIVLEVERFITGIALQFRCVQHGFLLLAPNSGPVEVAVLEGLA